MMIERIRWLWLAAPLLLLLLSTSAPVAAQTNQFTNPDASADFQPVWTLGDSMNITWTTSYEYADLAFQAQDSSWVLFFRYNLTIDWQEWVVDVNNSKSPSNTPYYFLLLLNTNDYSQNFTSELIVIDAPLAQLQSSTTESKVTATSKASALSTQDLPTTAAVTVLVVATAGPAASPTPTVVSKGLSAGAKAGIGVGVPLGIAAIVALAFLALIRFRRARRDGVASNPNAPVLPSHELYSDKAAPGNGVHYDAYGNVLPPDPRKMDGTAAGYYGPAELDPAANNAGSARYEMQGSEPRYEMTGLDRNGMNNTNHGLAGRYQPAPMAAAQPMPQRRPSATATSPQEMDSQTTAEAAERQSFLTAHRSQASSDLYGGSPSTSPRIGSGSGLPSSSPHTAFGSPRSATASSPRSDAPELNTLHHNR